MYLGKIIRLEGPIDDGSGRLLDGCYAKGGFGGRA